MELQMALMHLVWLLQLTKRESKQQSANNTKPRCSVRPVADKIGWDKRKVTTYWRRGSFPFPWSRQKKESV
jgi:hypothetical protein